MQACHPLTTARSSLALAAADSNAAAVFTLVASILPPVATHARCCCRLTAHCINYWCHTSRAREKDKTAVPPSCAGQRVPSTPVSLSIDPKQDTSSVTYMCIKWRKTALWVRWQSCCHTVAECEMAMHAPRQRVHGHGSTHALEPLNAKGAFSHSMVHSTPLPVEQNVPWSALDLAIPRSHGHAHSFIHCAFVPECQQAQSQRACCSRPIMHALP